MTTDTKGDIMRNYGLIAEKYYGYKISVIDLRNPMRSHGNNLLHLVNKYMDLFASTEELQYKAKAEKYAKIISKTIILSGMEGGNFGQNAYFYDAAEGLLTASILLVSEFCKPKERHIVSVFKIIQELWSPGKGRNRNQFQALMEKLPADHKAKWFAGAALNTAEQSMASVMSTALSRLNAFLDSELETILCNDTEIDAERFCNNKSAIFIIMPEEDNSKYFMVSLLIQQLYREILAVADENGGKLENRVVFYCDEFGTLPKIESAEMMFSASRSRRVSIVPIIQSFAQLEKNYGKRIMNFKEKLAMSKEKTEELKAKIAASAENAKKAHEAKKDEIKSNIDELNAEIDEFEKEFDDELEAGASLAIEEAGKALNKLGNELNEQAELDANAVEGGITAAKENARIARERAQSKLNTARLKAQMRVNAAKEKIAQIKTEKEKSKQEQRIAGLFDYAEDCRQLALAMALEAELTVLEAVAEIADYEEKYGDK